jgi:hypothetical protein
MTMPSNKTSIVGGLIVLLLLANIINYFWSNWGLITIHAKDKPIGQVIKSIERQGWVTIYSNIDPTLPITMDCDHVALPEAMETLSANVEYPAPADASGGGGGGGMRGGGAQWHLGFFVAPTSAQVKEEIRTFTEGADRDDDNIHVYNYPSPLAILGDDSTPAADPRKQIWPGLKMPPAPAADATAPDGTPLQPEAPPSSVQGYLRAFARQADIWIMAPSSWDPPVKDAPAPDGSISSAIRHFIGGAHGSVTQAIVLRGRALRVAGERPNRTGGWRGGGMDMSMMDDRMDNAINGLPPEAQPAARQKLADEKQFVKEMSVLPPEARWQRMRDHFMERRMDGDNSWRRSPDKRAKIYARLVAARQAATGK